MKHIINFKAPADTQIIPNSIADKSYFADIWDDNTGVVERLQWSIIRRIFLQQDVIISGMSGKSKATKMVRDLPKFEQVDCSDVETLLILRRFHWNTPRGADPYITVEATVLVTSVKGFKGLCDLASRYRVTYTDGTPLDLSEVVPASLYRNPFRKTCIFYFYPYTDSSIGVKIAYSDKLVFCLNDEVIGAMVLENNFLPQAIPNRCRQNFDLYYVFGRARVCDIWNDIYMQNFYPFGRG